MAAPTPRMTSLEGTERRVKWRLPVSHSAELPSWTRSVSTPVTMLFDEGMCVLWSVRDGRKRRAGGLGNNSAYSEARAKRNGLYVSVPPGGGSPKILAILWLSIMA